MEKYRTKHDLIPMSGWTHLPVHTKFYTNTMRTRCCHKLSLSLLYSSTRTEALFKSGTASIIFLETYLARTFFSTVGLTVACAPIQLIQSISVYNDMPPNKACSVWMDNECLKAMSLCDTNNGLHSLSLDLLLCALEIQEKKNTYLGWKQTRAWLAWCCCPFFTRPLRLIQQMVMKAPLCNFSKLYGSVTA